MNDSGNLFPLLGIGEEEKERALSVLVSKLCVFSLWWVIQTSPYKTSHLLMETEHDLGANPKAAFSYLFLGQHWIIDGYFWVKAKGRVLTGVVRGMPVASVAPAERSLVCRTLNLSARDSRSTGPPLVSIVLIYSQSWPGDKVLSSKDQRDMWTILHPN